MQKTIVVNRFVVGENNKKSLQSIHSFMFLFNIQLLNFKNYEELNMQFSPQINCLVGENGSGKTNLLDAIHYLSLAKSAFPGQDQQSIRHQEPFFSIRGEFRNEDRQHQVLCALQQGAKKVLRCDQVPYERLSDHVGRFPVVMMAPHDTDLIREGSEERRRFFDAIICQTDRNYLQWLMEYNGLLKQRNALLRQWQKNHMPADQDLLETYNIPLLDRAEKIARARISFLDQFEPLFQAHYQALSGGREEVSLRYRTEVLKEDFKEKFEQATEKDVVLGRTTMGVHRDDFRFLIGGHPVKRFGSQGQQKSFVVALKLSHFDLIHQQKGFKPILLLDDIFDKLDDQRMQHLLKMVAGHKFGQIFITDARPERTKGLVKEIDEEVKIFEIEKGVIQNKE
ncbi:DNA replication and repair protein RecF [Persicobacter diffluens]|uniref:DNA replication and repair protein RecF n=2 Tax=Persicobacter diffluens TaxID=981 RepID=A0AAN4VWL2_9BACT|nr:DNA replication and repair protein RecF [Persicobacter diffluens]